jgi:shikimate kinase
MRQNAENSLPAGAGTVILIGMMGSGKTHVGRLLATRLGRTFHDTDALVAARAGQSVAEIFERDGEAAFRDAETGVLRALLEGPEGAIPAVIATGGGIVLRGENMDMLRRSGFVVWLDTPPDILWARIGQDPSRPLLKGPDPEGTLRALCEARKPLYARAHARVEISDDPPEQVAERIIKLLSGAPNEARP